MCSLTVHDGKVAGKVVSSWGPYTSIVGTAVKTGVAGLTAEAELTAKVTSIGAPRGTPPKITVGTAWTPLLACSRGSRFARAAVT